MDYSEIINKVVNKIVQGDILTGEKILKKEYPNNEIVLSRRSYTIKEKMEQFKRDGFIDRYTGNRLLNPGILKILSYYYPDEFPYHPHWKMSECHIAYWELSPTINHIVPVSRGGLDDLSNWVTTSMLKNSIKNNWTLEELQWKLYEPGDLKIWDGLTSSFIKIVDNNALLSDNYIKRWYNVSKKI